ncbi:unextended protein-like [Babylonia areolata]|uniref:unextended protein-like n=1 Tax=Babylonia areolata TaxID=304850 RepID=UPI003FD123EE
MWHFQGHELWQRVAVKNEESKLFLPLAVQVTLLLLLLFLSGLFSGLNLGLMALDKTELQIIEKCGSETEKKYAKVIVPLRKRGNFLLCTLLLGNVMVNSTATIFIDNLSNGVVAVVASTICIVIFGEIIPQAVCSRHGLAVGANTHLITRFFMIITFPVSFPISLLLDRILGEEMGQVYNKEKLQELIRMTADYKVLEKDEANIIAGALQLASKRVENVMTKMEDVYMLNMDTVLDFELMSEILKSGYTRVPVYDSDTTNIVNILNTKDLALIDPDDSTPVRTVCNFYDHRPLYVDHDMKLDNMLQDFLQGASHMAIVQELQNKGDSDPYYKNIGVITLEDVIEEIIQSEIVDETDKMTDNRKKMPREVNRKLEYDVFEKQENNGPRISQQMAFAAYQYLSTTVNPFKEPYVKRSVLKQLIQQNIFITLNPSTDDSDIYKRSEECDYFVLILEGHVEVKIGKENLVFESGPFNYFGLECFDCLKDMKIERLKDVTDLRLLPPYTPDFSVKALTPMQFLRIHRVHYLAARRTSCISSSSFGDSHCSEKTFKDVWMRTVSQNNSAATLQELPEVDLSHVGLLHKGALQADSLLKDHDMANNQHSPTDTLDTKEGGSMGGWGLGGGEAITMDPLHSSSCSHSHSHSQGPDSQPQVDSQVREMAESGSRAGDRSSLSTVDGKAVGEGGDSSALMLLNGTDGSHGRTEARTDSDSEEREAEKARGDKAAVMNSKESMTSPSSEKQWVEEEDENAPLVGRESDRSRTCDS